MSGHPRGCGFMRKPNRTSFSGQNCVGSGISSLRHFPEPLLPQPSLNSDSATGVWGRRGSEGSCNPFNGGPLEGPCAWTATRGCALRRDIRCGGRRHRPLHRGSIRLFPRVPGIDEFERPERSFRRPAPALQRASPGALPAPARPLHLPAPRTSPPRAPARPAHQRAVSSLLRTSRAWRTCVALARPCYTDRGLGTQPLLLNDRDGQHLVQNPEILKFSKTTGQFSEMPPSVPQGVPGLCTPRGPRSHPGPLQGCGRVQEDGRGGPKGDVFCVVLSGA